MPATMETGHINVQTENIFPIIKKFLYSDHEIFLRELISNAVDATQKLKKLAILGDVKGEVGDTTIQVKLDKEAGTLTVSDRGIGMTADEVKKYINQIAFSSAEEFLEKFKGKTETEAATIIGHFGLGFYSSFMVAERVDIYTKSHKDAPAVKWSCDGSPEYSLEEIEKDQRGTDVVLHINDESKEFLEEQRVQELLNKYCKFLPVSIQFGEREETITKGEGDDAKEEKITRPNIVNNPEPAWTKAPADLTDEDYKNFYSELYPNAMEPPLFWIHLNVDYPFNLTGILYFPKLKNSFEVQQNRIQLYSNQVFVTDQTENIVPEFMVHLHGVIDSPDIPLNVSRSYLQSDPNVKKINSYVTRKVADKLEELFKKDREGYQDKWEHIGLFVKYGMLSDEKFYEKATKFCLLQDSDGKYYTLDEYRDAVKEQQTDKNDNVVFLYANHQEGQHSFIQAAKDAGYSVLLLDTVIDSHFVNHMESKLDNTQFKRVDADTPSKLIEKDEEPESVLSEDEEKKVTELFQEKADKPGVNVELKALAPEEAPVMVTRPEFMRRMRDMSASVGQDASMIPETYNVIVNTNHPLIGKLLKMRSADKKTKVVSQLYDLALLQQHMLSGSQMSDFIRRSVDLMD